MQNSMQICCNTLASRSARRTKLQFAVACSAGALFWVVNWSRRVVKSPCSWHPVSGLLSSAENGEKCSTISIVKETKICMANFQCFVPSMRGLPAELPNIRSRSRMQSGEPQRRHLSFSYLFLKWAQIPKCLKYHHKYGLVFLAENWNFWFRKVHRGDVSYVREEQWEKRTPQI